MTSIGSATHSSRVTTTYLKHQDEVDESKTSDDESVEFFSDAEEVGDIKGIDDVIQEMDDEKESASSQAEEGFLWRMWGAIKKTAIDQASNTIVHSYLEEDSAFLKALTADAKLCNQCKKFSFTICDLIEDFVDEQSDIYKEYADKFEMALLHLFANSARKIYPELNKEYLSSGEIEKPVTLEDLTKQTALLYFEVVMQGFNEIDVQIKNGTPFNADLFDNLTHQIIHLIVSDTKEEKSLYANLGWKGAWQVGEKKFVKQYFGSFIKEGLIAAYTPLQAWLKEPAKWQEKEDPKVSKKGKEKVEATKKTDSSAEIDLHHIAEKIIPAVQPLLNYFLNCFCEKFKQEDLKELNQFTTQPDIIVKRITDISSDIIDMLPELAKQFGDNPLFEMGFDQFGDTFKKLIETILLRLFVNMALENPSLQNATAEQFFAQIFFYVGNLVTQNAGELAPESPRQKQELTQFIPLVDALAGIFRKRLDVDLNVFIHSRQDRLFEPIALYLMTLYQPVLSLLQSEQSISGPSSLKEGETSSSSFSSYAPLLTPFMQNHLIYFAKCLSLHFIERGEKEIKNRLIAKDATRVNKLIKELGPKLFQFIKTYLVSIQADNNSFFQTPFGQMVNHVIQNGDDQAQTELIEGIIYLVLTGILNHVFPTTDQLLPLKDVAKKVMNHFVNLFQVECTTKDSKSKEKDFYPLAKKILDSIVSSDSNVYPFILLLKAPFATILTEIFHSFASLDVEKENYEDRLRYLLWDKETIKQEHPEAQIPDEPSKEVSKAFNVEIYVDCVTSVCDQISDNIVTAGKEFLAKKDQDQSDLLDLVLGYFPDLSKYSKNALKILLVRVLGAEFSKKKGRFSILEKQAHQMLSLLFFKVIVHIAENVKQPKNKSTRLSPAELVQGVLQEFLQIVVGGFRRFDLEDKIHKYEGKEEKAVLKGKLTGELGVLKVQQKGGSFASHLLAYFFPANDEGHTSLNAHIPGFSLLRHIIAEQVEQKILPNLLKKFYQTGSLWINKRAENKKRLKRECGNRYFIVTEACKVAGQFVRDFIPYYLQKDAADLSLILLNEFGEYLVSLNETTLSEDHPKRIKLNPVLENVIQSFGATENGTMEVLLDFIQIFTESALLEAAASFIENMQKAENAYEDDSLVQILINIVLEKGKIHFNSLKEAHAHGEDPIQAFHDGDILHSGLEISDQEDAESQLALKTDFLKRMGDLILDNAEISEDRLPIWPSLLRGHLWKLFEATLFPKIIEVILNMFAGPKILNNLLLYLLNAINSSDKAVNEQHNLPEIVFGFIKTQFSEMAKFVTVKHPEKRTEDHSTVEHQTESRLKVEVQQEAGKLFQELLGLQRSRLTNYILQFENVQDVVGKSVADQLFQIVEGQSLLNIFLTILHGILPNMFPGGEWDDENRKIIMRTEAGSQIAPFFNIPQMMEEIAEGEIKLKEQVVKDLADTIEHQTLHTLQGALDYVWESSQQGLDDEIEKNLGASGLKAKRKLDNFTRFIYNNGIRILLMAGVVVPYAIFKFALHLVSKKQARKRKEDVDAEIHKNFMCTFFEQLLEKVSKKMGEESDLGEDEVGSDQENPDESVFAEGIVTS